MKKFGRLFAVAALSVATLTAGVFGLSGCADKWKNTNNDPTADLTPVGPPVHEQPEEKPAVEVVSLDSFKAFLNKEDLETTLDGYKLVSNDSYEGIDTPNIEFLTLKSDEGTKSILKLILDNGDYENLYSTGAEVAVYIESKVGEEISKIKLVDEKIVQDEMKYFDEVSLDVADVKSKANDVLQLQEANINAKYVISKTTYKENISFNVTMTYSGVGKFDDSSETEVALNFTNIMKIDFDGTKLSGYELEMTKKETGTNESKTTKISVERIESLEMPEDLESYEEQSSIERLQAYINQEGVVSTLNGFKITGLNAEDDFAGTVCESVEYSAIRTESGFKASYFVKIDEQNSKNIYYTGSDSVVYIKTVSQEGVDEEKITDETKFTEYYQLLADIAEQSLTFSDVVDELANLEADFYVTKITNDNKTIFKVEYKLFDSVENSETSYVIEAVFVDGVIEKYSVTSTEISESEEISISKFEVVAIEDVEFPSDLDSYIDKSASEGEENGDGETGSENGGETSGGENGEKTGEVVGGEEGGNETEENGNETGEEGNETGNETGIESESETNGFKGCVFSPSMLKSSK